MALTGLEIYKQLPKTNCKECGFPTCLAFAMKMAAGQVPLEKCTEVTEEAKAALESASRPPIQLVTIGTDQCEIKIGNETQLYRHEERFHRPAAVAVRVSDALGEDDFVWDFGDGFGATGKVVQHTFSSADVFTVALTVQDALGLGDTDFVTIDLSNHLPEIVTATATPTSGEVPVSVNFTFPLTGRNSIITRIDRAAKAAMISGLPEK